MLRLENVYMSYQDKQVLHDISFELEKSRVTCLLGPNGSGKTTIIKVMNGLLVPEKGRIIYQKQLLSEMTQKQIARLISVVPQEHSYTFDYKCIDLVLMGATPYLKFGTMPSEDEYRRAEAIMENMNISDLADRNFDNLSGGEKQLVLIARALMQDTEYMLMDEPTTHLDFKNRHLLLQRLRELAAGDTGLLLSLHNPNLALQYSDRVIVIKEGKIIASGPAAEVINRENLSKAYDIDIKVNRQLEKVEINNITVREPVN